MRLAFLRCIENSPGARWARPVLLFVRDLCGWRWAGEYPSERAAKREARRRGLSLIDESDVMEDCNA